MRKILFIGPPGSGKGTQAKLLKKYKLFHVSIGKSIRNSIKKKDLLVMPYKKTVQQGNLIPDKIVLKIIQKNIKVLPKNCKGYVLDGGARTLFQAKQLVKKQLINEVIYFKLNQKIATKRLLKRAKIKKRKDDNPKSIKERFEEFDKRTKPALAYLKKKTEFFTIDASSTITEVNKEVARKLKL